MCTNGFYDELSEGQLAQVMVQSPWWDVLKKSMSVFVSESLNYD